MSVATFLAKNASPAHSVTTDGATIAPTPTEAGCATSSFRNVSPFVSQAVPKASKDVDSKQNTGPSPTIEYFSSKILVAANGKKRA